MHIFVPLRQNGSRALRSVIHRDGCEREPAGTASPCRRQGRGGGSRGLPKPRAGSTVQGKPQPAAESTRTSGCSLGRVCRLSPSISPQAAPIFQPKPAANSGPRRMEPGDFSAPSPWTSPTRFTHSLDFTHSLGTYRAVQSDGLGHSSRGVMGFGVAWCKEVPANSKTKTQTEGIS